MMITLLKINLKINPTFIVFPSPNHMFLAFLSRVIPKQAIWHFRLGHLSYDRLSKIYQIYPQVFSDNKAICDVFHFVRHKNLPFSLSNSRATHKFELLHFDIWGSVSINSIHNHKYFLTVVDDYSRFVWIVILKTKSEVSSHVQQFITLIENLFQTCPKYVRSDNGLGFLMSQFLIPFLPHKIGNILSDLYHKSDLTPIKFHDIPTSNPSIQSSDKSIYDPSTSSKSVPNSPTHNPNIPHDIPLVPQPFATNQPHPTSVSSRVRNQLSHLKDYVCTSFNDSSNPLSSCTLYSISKFIS